MKTIELFCGTKSFSKVMAQHGYRTFTVDNDSQFNPDLLLDIGEMHHSDLPYKPGILWASPPCQSFSVATIGRNWYHDGTPKTDKARNALLLIVQTLAIIKELEPTWWFIENPVGKLRVLPPMLDLEIARHTVTYCQYGDTRMKPTDIWTNAYWWTPRPRCSPGATCHESAPRGSKTGTQGLKNAKERGVIPSELFEEILKQKHFLEEDK